MADIWLKQKLLINKRHLLIKSLFHSTIAFVHKSNPSYCIWYIYVCVCECVRVCVECSNQLRYAWSLISAGTFYTNTNQAFIERGFDCRFFFRWPSDILYKI